MSEPKCIHGTRLTLKCSECVKEIKNGARILDMENFEIGADPPIYAETVNHPSHYTQGGIECIDAIQAALTPEEFIGFCKGNILKYLWREKVKGGAESLKKAKWYIERLLNVSFSKRD